MGGYNFQHVRTHKCENHLSTDEMTEALISAESYLDMCYARPMAAWDDSEERNETIRVATLKAGTLKAALKGVGK